MGASRNELSFIQKLQSPTSIRPRPETCMKNSLLYGHSTIFKLNVISVDFSYSDKYYASTCVHAAMITLLLTRNLPFCIAIIIFKGTSFSIYTYLDFFHFFYILSFLGALTQAIRNFAKSLEGWLSNAMNNIPQRMIQTKVK